MVKVYGPMFSMDASGTLADTATFSKWKGRNYVRQRVVPSNPRSALQTGIRAMLKFLSQAWAAVTATPQGSWDDRAEQSSISAFNAYVGHNMDRWNRFDAPGQTDPVAETGTEPVATFDSATGGDSHIDLAFTITTLNDVWGVMIFRSTSTGFATSKANCIAVLEVDSTGAFVYTDSPLAAGTYYYNARFFTKEGVLGAEEGEQSDAAT